jgi:ubiquinone biosynthesis protein UbiJ
MRDRGILTERDREIIPEEPNNDRRPEVKTRVKNRIDRLERDLTILEEHEPALAEQLREAICAGTEEASIKDVLEEVQALRDDLTN